MKIRVTCNQEVIAEVAKELGLPVLEVKDIVNSQSLFTKQVMESSTFDGVRWPYFGVFKAKPKEIQIINHLKGLNEEQKKEFKLKLKQGFYNHEITKRRKRERSKGGGQGEVNNTNSLSGTNPN